jgi:hypothetical protein
VSYQDQHDTASDKGFQDRVTMCVATNAETFVDDTRPEYQNLAYQAISALESTAAQFVPLVACAPAMSVDSTDADINAAVQAMWPKVGARYVPVNIASVGP